MHPGPSSRSRAAAVIGGGPAGLIAAERLSAAGVAVTVYDRMPSLGRRFLMAGRGGLNLTHSEPLDRFVGRYGAAADWAAPMLARFTPTDLVTWAEGLGQPTFVGSSGRVFPRALKASPLLRAWLSRLAEQGVQLRTRHDWLGWDASGDLRFRRSDGVEVSDRPDATLLALGGASWPRLGADGGWVPLLRERGVEIKALKPANCGFHVDWSPIFSERFQGQALKAVAVGFSERQARGEVMIAAQGLEGGAIYALGAGLREAIEAGHPARITLDLRPDETAARLAERLAGGRRGDSLSNRLRRALNLSPAAIGLLREAHGVELPTEPLALAESIKAAPITLTAPFGIDRSISTAGGVARAALDDGLMLRALPGVYAAGEMLDWEAPTGGYLLQACFATGVVAAEAIIGGLGIDLKVPASFDSRSDERGSE